MRTVNFHFYKQIIAQKRLSRRSTQNEEYLILNNQKKN